MPVSKREPKEVVDRVEPSLTSQMRRSENLPLFAWTKGLVSVWMRLNMASAVSRVLRVDRDLFVDLYLIFMVPILVALLALSPMSREISWLSWLPYFSVVLAVWMLQEIACVTLFDLVRTKPIRGRKRWMLATLPTATHVVLCFAILFLHLGERFTPPVRDPLTAVYISVTTFATLGYGDIHPAQGSAWGQAIVICEQSLFLLLVVIRVPMAISMLRVHDIEDEQARGKGRS